MTTSQTFTTPRFGTIEFEPNDVVTLKDGMVGFSQCSQFLVLQHKEGSPFRWFLCLNAPEIAFLVVEPSHFVPQYALQVHPSQLEDIGLTDPATSLVYTIVTIPRGNPEGMTLNLAGPIVINAINQQAKQLVLDDPKWPLKYPAIPPEARAA